MQSDNVDYPRTTQTAISLCPGIRGLERGIELAGTPLRVLTYVEIEAFIIANLVAEMQAGLLAPSPIWSDIKSFDGRKFRGLVDIITGGYPCTPFSLAGKRGGAEDERHLWPYISEIVDAVRPRICYFENVDDHLTLGFDQVYRDLRDMGYIVEAGVFSAEEVGAPHERQRIFILALENSAAQRWGRRRDAGGDGRWPFQTEGSSPLANTDLDDSSSIGLEQEHKISTRGHCADSAGQMVNPTSKRSAGGHGDLSGKDESKRQSEEQLKDESGILECTSPRHGLADTHSDGGAYGRGEIQDHSGEGQEKKHGKERNKKKRKRSGADIIGGGEHVGLADTFSPGHEGSKRRRSLRKQGEAAPESVTERSEVAGGMDDTASTRLAVGGFIKSREGHPIQMFECGGEARWPARPGQQQYSWEEPRILEREAESEVGLSAHGYNFREDVLRAVGNSVVPWQSAIAWINLWRKMKQNVIYGMDKNS